MITAWRLGLDRILHVFNVRSIASIGMSPTVHFQTELAINTHVTVSDIGVQGTTADIRNIGVDVRDVPTSVVVSDLPNDDDVVNATSMFSYIHCNIMPSRGETKCQTKSVSIHNLSVNP